MKNRLSLLLLLLIALFMTACTHPAPAASTTSPTISQTSNLPPFLAIPVSSKLPNLEISQGWKYSEDERSIHPGIPTHYGADIPAPWGTPVYAAADGMAVASYHTYDMLDSRGRTIGYGIGLFVQIWHEKEGVFTSYCHLSGINNKLIPYIDPIEKNGNWVPQAALYVPLDEFLREAKPVKQGDLIGYVGYTGLRNGYPERASNPPMIDQKKDHTWDPHGAHLHWEVYTRNPLTHQKEKRYDPFGIYDVREQYSDVFNRPCGLILDDGDGHPKFAAN